jgi:uncharacterized RmlC-like cupin family protein
MSNPIRVITAGELQEADPTPGMRRQQAVRAGYLWSGLVHTAPGAVSGWHHHGEHETALYVVTGCLRLEFGPGGKSMVDARAGQFAHIPAGVVHRESNPGEEASTAVIARAGTGAPTVNVEAPAVI